MFKNAFSPILCSMILALSAPFAWSQSHTYSGFAHGNVYPFVTDVDGDAQFVLNTALNMPNRLSYFGFINVFDRNPSGFGSDGLGYFSEQNLRWQVTENSPFDLTFQANFRIGESNDRYRLGVRWRLNQTQALKSFFDALHMRYAINLHAVQFDSLDGSAWQIEHSFGFRFPYLTDRLYLAGFVDHNFDEPLPDSIPDDPIVAEAQLGYRLHGNWFAVAEYRINQYRRTDVNTLAIGIEYKHSF